MAKYVWRDGATGERGQWIDKATGEPMEIPDRPVQRPLVFADLPGYRSPIDGKWIEGRRARRYDLEKNNCVDANEVGSPTGGKFRNKRFCDKHGLTVSDEYRD